MRVMREQFTDRIVETHFGLIEDLRTDNTTNKNNDQLGYTDAPVDVHTGMTGIKRKREGERDDFPLLPPKCFYLLNCQQISPS